MFGLDAGTTPSWTDLGSPNPAAIMVAGLAVLEDALYAATWEGPPSERGHVYRLDGQGWTDCGSPLDCNAVTRLAVSDGRLYAGVSRLRGGGSGLPDSVNQGPGGRVLRYEGGQEWTDLGRLGDADSVAGLIPFGGELYAIPMYSEGLYRFLEPGRWDWCGSPGRRLLALGVHEGALYGAGNDHADVVSAIAQTAAGIVVPQRSPEGGGGIYRYEGGTSWTSLGLQPDTTQVYSIETYDGEMHVGTWPNGIVYRRGPDGGWHSCGRLGEETEVMNLLAFNGLLYAGTLPRAQVFRMDGPDTWAEIGRLDWTPDVLYRRAASMAVHRGRLVVGTLPSGHVHAMRVGQAVSSGRAVPPGDHHVAAVRRGPTLELYLDGALLANERDPAGATLDLGELPALTSGSGPRAPFAGNVTDPMIRAGAMDASEIARLASARPGS
jgi:Concanavalin A-like lectin/glucanases superfamily